MLEKSTWGNPWGSCESLNISRIYAVCVLFKIKIKGAIKYNYILLELYKSEKWRNWMKYDVFITEEETGVFFLTKKLLTNFKSTHHNMHIQVGIAVLKWSTWMTRNLAFCNCLSGLQNTHSFFHLFGKHLYHEPFYSLRWELSFPSRCLYSSKVEKPSATWTQVSEEGIEGSVRRYPLA